MSGGEHGLQPSGHEHVHCRFCGANGVHVVPKTAHVMGLPGDVCYGPHEVKGGTVQCVKSKNRVVSEVDRHQGDPS